MSSQRGLSDSRLAVIGDTGALLARVYYMLPSYKFEFYTTSACFKEVKDAENREALLNALELGLVKVVDAGDEYISMAVEEAKSIGELGRLSEADLSVIALALELAGKRNVVVLTDDYSLQNTLHHLGLSFKPVRTEGIKQSFRYREYCPVCGYVPGKPGEKTCPICGSPIRRIRVS